ncbi:hypothetical protein F3N42_00865 [Marinihelvus fidelis]|uniref:OmpR/PhoB-type domain-containing protein n=1 Tax=Marinihelvus fidelis TaxID=2613842 RepID=A0A5N0TI17_9GAMM|nr:winged helix-turn-helix domain-containing protein [Marinihelvus fidelis]KAA9134128.1 hypothetical protein F3N42_00865 [Marinihelvus fidelis]
MDQAATHAFGPWRFDALTGDLSTADSTTRLEPQVARLLAFFLDHQDVLQTRDDLIDGAWDGRLVSDHAINRCISILRHTLTPDDRNAYIETVVRRGFVSHFPPAETEVTRPETTPSTQRRTRRGMAARVVLVVLIAVAAVVIERAWPPEAPPARPFSATDTPLIAVLPFMTTSLDEDSEFLAKGMHDDLLTRLAQLQSLRVVSRTSVQGYRGTERNIREIGRALRADAILEGGIQRSGDNVRINMQLIDARDDSHLWAGQYDRQLSATNLFTVQSEITEAVSTALHTQLTEQDSSQLKLLPTDNMAAYRAWHQALQVRFNNGMGDPAYREYLEAAVELDPGFVRAWAELVGVISYTGFEKGETSAIAHLNGLLERIRKLSPGSAEHLLAQTYYTYYTLRDYPLAGDLVRQVRGMHPNDPQVLELQSWIQRRLGDFDGKAESVRLASVLDPMNPYWNLALSASLMVTHRYDEALDAINYAAFRTVELDYTQALLSLRDTGDLAGLPGALSAIEREHGDTLMADLHWNAAIGARDYEGALEVIDAFESGSAGAQAWTHHPWPEPTLAHMVTLWFMGDTEGLQPLLAEARERLGIDEITPQTDEYDVMNLAYLAAIDGDQSETERLVRAWQRKASQDLANLANNTDYACRVLGMAGATAATVQCLRDGLDGPSMVMPFMEPHLPFYDAIREAPAFVTLVNSLDD